MKVEAVVHTGRGYVTAFWKELLYTRTFIEDYGEGPEEIVIPHYGKVLAASKKLPRSEWREGEHVTEFVERILGPRPI